MQVVSLLPFFLFLFCASDFQSVQVAVEEVLVYLLGGDTLIFLLIMWGLDGASREI